MAINLGLNIITNNKLDHTVSVVASSGITLATVNSSTKRLTGSATENVVKEICTVTFTAKQNFYYSQVPSFKSNFKNGELIITSSETKDSLNRIKEKVFVISAKAGVNTIYNNIIFNEKIDVSIVAGVNNSILKQINGISFNTSDIQPGGTSQQIIVNGTKNSKYTITLKRSSDNKSYDFSSDTFTASSTNSGVLTIPESGASSTNIIFPSTSSLINYTMQVFADSSTEMLSSVNNVFNFSQLNNVTVTFNCVSSDSSYVGSSGSLPSAPVITGINSGTSGVNTIISLEPKLHTKAFKKAKEIQDKDFETRTTSTTTGGNTTTTSVTLASSNAKILVGMKVTGTGISNDVTVSAISGTSLTLSGAPGGTITEGATLTFIGAGAGFIKDNSGLIFSIANTAEDLENIASFVINEVSKTVDANSSNGTITLANAEEDSVGTVVGIYKGVSTVSTGANMQGLKVTDLSSSQNTIVLDGTPTVKTGQVITFGSAGRVAEISFVLNITQFPTENTVVNLNLDNILTIDPQWA